MFFEFLLGLQNTTTFGDAGVLRFSKTSEETVNNAGRKQLLQNLHHHFEIQEIRGTKIIQFSIFLFDQNRDFV